MKEAKEKNATILFQDESGVQSRPNVRRTWSLRGKRPAIRVREKRDKISISSAVSADGDLYFAIKEGSMNEDDILSFLDQLLSEIHGFLYIFWDNIMIHRSGKVKEYLGTHNDRLITRRIPAYSPELNPDELVWNALKYLDLPNFCPESMNENHIIMFLDQLLSEINGFLYIFWDNIMIHRSNKVKEYLGVHNDRLITRRIPAYSPELNPDEFVWNALKYQELPNFCPKSYDKLYSTAENTLVKMKANLGKMKRIIRGTKLPLPSTLGKQ